jgi:hypothetical protein
MAARPRMAAKAKVPSFKPPPSKVQVYLSKTGLGAALEREAKMRRLSLSQTAEAILERGLKGKIEADPGDRLLMIERRLSDHMRLTARDLFVVEEMLFIALRTMISRLPEHPREQSDDYRAEVNIAMDQLLDELSRKVRQGRMQFEAALSDTGHPNPPTADAANDRTPAQTEKSEG